MRLEIKSVICTFLNAENFYNEYAFGLKPIKVQGGQTGLTTQLKDYLLIVDPLKEFPTKACVVSKIFA